MRIHDEQKGISWIFSLLVVAFAVVVCITFYHSNHSIEQGYLTSEGNAAENFAVLTASNIHLTDAQVEKLKQYSYLELLQSEENEQLRRMMDNDNFTNTVDYAYVMVHLDKDEVKYQVTETNQTLFEAPLGTDLDILWLLDVIVNPDLPDAKTLLSDDMERYFYYNKDEDFIFREAPTHLFQSDEWGDHICGYAPLYSTEGNYIGVIGVDLRTQNYDKYRFQAMLAMGLLFGITTLSLTLLFVILYQKYRKLQFEKIYTDALTHCYNRTYYNDQFIKKLNLHHPPDHYFALMIADIDWFKKVNDTFGHDIGDQVLMELSALLIETFGKSNIIRFGGEEFVVGLWFKDEATLRQQLDELYGKISSRKFSNRQITISMSLGCCYTAEQDLTGWLLSDLLKIADGKLYEAKKNGRRHYRLAVYEPPQPAEK